MIREFFIHREPLTNQSGFQNRFLRPSNDRGTGAPIDQHQYIQVLLIVPEEKKSVFQSGLYPFDLFHSLIGGVAASAIFNPDLLSDFQFTFWKFYLITEGI